MLKYDLVEWVDVIQPEMLRQGYTAIPNCKRAKFAGNFEREFHIEFLSREDELCFILQFGRGATMVRTDEVL